jgi:hypothetical protein
MKCPNDQNEMEKGFISRSVWISESPFLGGGFLEMLTKIGVWPTKRKVNFVNAYRCPKCGKVDFYSELSKNF